MTTFLIDTITSRETYLAYRQNWRDSYRALSEAIRELKIKIKNDDRAYRLSHVDVLKRISLSRIATAMLAELKEAKRLARFQKQKSVA